MMIRKETNKERYAHTNVGIYGHHIIVEQKHKNIPYTLFESKGKNLWLIHIEVLGTFKCLKKMHAHRNFLLNMTFLLYNNIITIILTQLIMTDFFEKYPVSYKVTLLFWLVSYTTT